MQKKKSKTRTFKKQKSLERRVADDLVRLHERNEELRKKDIGTSFLDLF